MIEAFDENRSKQVGRALALAKARDVVDATVVIGALERGDLVITSDPDDLQRISDAMEEPLALHVV